jgi:hypothetical protein
MKRFAYVVLMPLIAMTFVCKKEARVEREGIVNLLAGTVTIIDGSNKTAAKVGDIVRKGMKIETGSKAFIDIYFDENAVKVLENSIVEIKTLEAKLEDGSENGSYYVNKGKVFTRIMKKLAKNDNFSITTPTTTAGVRGTEFLVEAGELKSLVACLNGSVEVKNDASPGQEPVRINDEQQVIIEKDKPMKVEELSSENRNLMKDIRKNFQEMKQDIRERFEKKREEIRKAVIDQRQKNKEMVEKQKARDMENVEKQKAGDKENVDRLKGISDKTGTEARESIDRQKEESQKKLEGVKPDIKKFKSKVE